MFASTNVWASPPIVAQDHIEQLEQEAIERVITTVTPSLIRFETIGGMSRVDEVAVSPSPSTGTVVTKDGYVVSASFHFAHQPASIFATLPDGTKATAEIVGRDPTRKIVLLKIDSEVEFIAPEPLERSAVRVGETVIGVGRAMDAEFPNVTTGIVSATNRVWGRAIQTDAKISPANFGGPLLNLEGKVAGILVPMSPDDDAEMAGTQWYDSGIGFAVPLTDILDRMEALKNGKELRKGLLGVSLKGADLFASTTEVAFCQGSSPAGKAGIKPGDFVVGINGQAIRRHSDVKHAVGPLYEGDLVKIKVDRGGKEIEFEFELAGEIEKFEAPGIGILADDDSDEPGIVVTHVFAESAAKKSGLVAGTRILALNGNPVLTVKSLREKLFPLEIGSVVKLKISSSDEGSQVVDVEVEKISANVPEFETDFAIEVSETIEVNVPDFANKCIAIVPKTGEDSISPSLLVWLPEPGKFKSDVQERLWKSQCEKHNMIVLVPQSTDSKKWSPDDSDFIIGAIDSLKKNVAFAESRVAVGGTKASGTMAGLVAFGQRGLFRGVVLIDSGLSRRTPTVETSPSEPLMVLIGSKDSGSKQTKVLVDRLSEEKFPVAVEQNMGRIADVVDSVARWVRSLDRL